MSDASPGLEVWSEGAAYEAYVGRWSRPVARELVRWLEVPRGSAWLDVGCGAGALVEAIVEQARPRAVGRRSLESVRRLSGVEMRAIDVPTPFRDFEDYWSPFLGGQGPAPAYAMSLPEDRRVELREALRRVLPVAADGSIPLSARAWAVRGSKGG